MRNKESHIERWLSKEERDIIDKTPGLHSFDYIVLAKVNKILSEDGLAEQFDRCRAINYQHYMAQQWSWTAVEQWLVGERVDGSLSKEKQQKQKTELLIEDFQKNKNGIRFKVFYCLKYPGRMTW